MNLLALLLWRLSIRPLVGKRTVQRLMFEMLPDTHGYANKHSMVPDLEIVF